MRPLARLASALLLALPLLGAPACLAPPPPAVPQLTQTFTDPAGFYTILAPGPAETPRPGQDITHVGPVRFKVQAFDRDPYAFRVYGFEYPWCGSPDPSGCGPIFKFDAAGDTGHASGKAIARMRGRQVSVQPLTVGGTSGRDVTFSVPGGHGALRILIARPPRPRRWVAWCLTAADRDLGPCLAFVRSLQPVLAAGP